MPTLEVWQGPSELDGAPIVLLASTESGNQKTGNMIQTWILRSDVPPGEALRTGKDKSICGDCKLAGGACYVMVDWAPRQIWESWKRKPRKAADNFAKGRAVRLGAYGDPAAVPFQIWGRALKGAAGHTGYTHQWKAADPRLADLCMASVDNHDELVEAQKRGWRTYRVGMPDEPLAQREVLCPYEAGIKITCLECMACTGGDRRGSIFTPIHGSAAKQKAFLKTRTRNVEIEVCA